MRLSILIQSFFQCNWSLCFQEAALFCGLNTSDREWPVLVRGGVDSLHPLLNKKLE